MRCRREVGLLCFLRKIFATARSAPPTTMGGRLGRRGKLSSYDVNGLGLAGCDRHGGFRRRRGCLIPSNRVP